jgi:hypothetical protein
MNLVLSQHAVMAGLVPAIHAVATVKIDVDARDKPGHDGACGEPS